MLGGMRAFLLASLLAAAAPSTVHAGLLIEGSLGAGWQTSDQVTTASGTTLSGTTPVELMVAPGWGFADVLRLQVGFLGHLGDSQSSTFDFELRPMVTVSPPLFPLYLRAIFAVQNLTNDRAAKVAYGGALGLRIGVLGAGAFVEAGVLPRTVKVAAGSTTEDRSVWFVEGRVGAYYEF
jgi:hypothetical protein